MCHVFVGPGVNLAELKPVLASSQRLATEHVSRMVDASLSTQWASATGDVAPWAWVDLLGVYNVPWPSMSVTVGVSFFWVEICYDFRGVLGLRIFWLMLLVVCFFEKNNRYFL